jgi:amino acid adenylation domain-containing protein
MSTEVFVFPASFAQQRLWFLDQLEPGSPAYNVPAAVRLSGRLDVAALKHSLREVIRRHESLRTTFSVLDGRPVQVIAAATLSEMEIVSLESLPAGDREEQALRLAGEEARASFDLHTGPLIRTRLLRLSENEHILLLTMHHIVSDGWSAGIFVRETAALYEAYSRGNGSPLPDLQIQYADYAEWQREYLQGETVQELVAYWKNQLDGNLFVAPVSSDRRRPAVRSYKGARQRISLGKTLTAALNSLSRQEDVTLFMTLLTAFQTLLYRYSGLEDFTIGSTIAGRNRRETEDLIGFFLNTLVLRAEMRGDPSFRELLQRVKATALGAFEHQDLPVEMILDVLQPERKLNQNPLFQTLFIFQTTPMPVLELENLKLELMEIDTGTAKFDLTLELIEKREGLCGFFEYDTDLFETETVARMATHFEVVLKSIAADSDQRLSQVQLLSPQERQTLLTTWSGTDGGPEAELCVHQLFEAQVEKAPETTAVVFENEQLSYAELNRRANQLAHYLRRIGVKPETRVGLLMERSPEAIIALLGVLKAGGAYVPLDPSYPPERLKMILDDARAPIVLSRVPTAAWVAVAKVSEVCLNQTWEKIAQESEQNLPAITKPSNLAYVIYTSGSTGTPKGVAVQHGSLVSYTRFAGREFNIAPDDRVLQFASLSFDTSAEEIYPCLTLGATLVLRTELMLGSVAGFLEKCGQWGITVLDLPTAYWHEITARLTNESLTLPMNLRLVILGGEKALSERLVTWRRHGKDIRVVNTYGPTETTIVVTMHDLTSDNAGDDGSGEIPIGRAIENTQTYVLDSRLEPVPIGIAGELCIAGGGLARGYLDRAGLTAERFIPNSFSRKPGRRLYRTGDLVRYLRNGALEFLGRADAQVKLRGFRVELGEIETALRQNQSVHDAVVTVREDEPGNKRLIAYVVWRAGQAANSGELRSFLRAKVPDYMLPAAFVELDALPLTPTGKIDRGKLPAPQSSVLALSYVAPRTPVEEMLAGIWSEVLQLEQVGVEDNFFDLGGHSLLATQLFSRVREIFKVEVPVRRIFEAPTVAELAQTIETMIRTEQRSQTPPLVPVARDGDLPLSFAQERLWFLNQLDPDSAAYHVLRPLQIEGPLDVPLMQAVISEVVARHEVYRTTFPSVNGRPKQVIHPPYPVSLPVVDLSELSQSEREAAAHRIILAEGERVFDLARGPLWRLVLLRMSAEVHILMLTEHHLVHDGWTEGALVRDFLALYVARVAGSPLELPDLPVQYADFAHWQRQWLKGEILDELLSYWKEHLRGADPSLQLPLDRPRPAVQTFRGALTEFTLSEELTKALNDLSRREGVTPFMTLFGAFNALLHRYSKQQDIVVATSIANRKWVEVENLTGFFVNTLVLRTDFSGNPTGRELLQRVRETSLGAYAHQDLPFEKLVEAIQPERELNRQALFQVMFILQNAPRGVLDLPNLTIRQLHVHNHTSKFDLLLSMVERDGRLSGALEYNTDILNQTTIDRMLGHFEVLLQELVRDAGQRLSDITLMAEEERQKVLFAWNDTSLQYAQDSCLPQVFETQAARTPESPAVLFDETRLTYGELNERANKLASYLRRLGAGAESRVGICVERSPEMVVGLLGILKAGAAYVPLDPAYPSERLGFILDDAEVSLLLTQENTLGALPGYRGRIIRLDTDWETIAQESDANPPGQIIGDNLAYVIYTSGSTGKPKGVQISHRALMNFLTSMQQTPGITSQDQLLAVTTLSFDIAGLEIYLPLTTGACVRIVSREAASDGAKLFSELAHSGATMMQGTPASWRLLLDAGWPGDQHLKILCGGEALPHELANQLLERCHSLWNMYGPTETTIWSAVHRIEPGNGSVLIGRPIANTQLYLLDDNLQPAPVGVPGELYIGGDGLARGYFRQPQLTAEKFIPNSFGSTGSRLYRTGDLARYLPDGDVEFLGRIDHQVKIRGFRIELSEIESVLEQHSFVREAVVTAREDKPGDKRLAAYVVTDLNLNGASEVKAEWRKEQIDQWQIAWNEAYSEPRTPAEPSFNIAGWNSSYTGLAIPSAEMREWLDGTVARILALRPNRVLEIGCGTGLLLCRLAPHCEEYFGTDISASALDYVLQQIADRQLSRVNVLQKEADDFSWIQTEPFDVVILNSVAQYFPDVDHFVRVLEGVMRVIPPGGSIFLGDIRNLPLLEAFHTSVQMHQAKDSTNVSELRRRIHQAMAQEEELVIAPAFFNALASRFPRISDVRIQLKPGRYHNELTRFRYDVVLDLGCEQRRSLADSSQVNWESQPLRPTDIRDMLRLTRPAQLKIANVPNARLQKEMKTVELLAAAREDQSIRELRAALDEVPLGEAVEPEEFWALGKELPYTVEIGWTNVGNDGRFDVVFRRQETNTAGSIGEPANAATASSIAGCAWPAYANNPLEGRFRRTLMPKLRAYLKEKLPEYMVPSYFVALESLPRTPNGKIDRRLLPVPVRLSDERPAAGSASTPSPAEELLSSIWSQILGVENVGLHENFFDLGGHSLLATQLISRVRDAFKVELPLRALFESPTIATLTRTVLAAQNLALPLATPVRPRQKSGPARLSFAQRRLWFVDRLKTTRHSYNLPVAVRVKGNLNVPALERALGEIIRRHDSLRTTFALVDGEPLQIVSPESGVRLPTVDLRKIEAHKRELEARDLIRDEACKPFDLSSGPLLRAQLLRLAEADHILLLTMHHIVSDGWSMEVLIREMAVLYEAFNDGRQSPLTELKLQYADYAEWQREYLQGEVLQGLLDYWKAQLAGVPPLQLPTDRPRPVAHSYFGEKQALELGIELTDRLKELSRSENTTLFMTLLAAFAVLLYRYSEQEDILIGTDVANRNRSEIEGLIGFFVNMVVMRVKPCRNASFTELLSSTREVALGAYAHEHLPFEKLVEELNPQRSLSHNPLFQVAFVLHNNLGPLQSLSNLELSRVEINTATAMFDLLLSMVETPQGLIGTLNYSTDLFDDGTIARMLQHFRNLLESVVLNPDLPISELQLLSDEERGGLSAADFPDAGISQKDFENLILTTNPNAL